MSWFIPVLIGFLAIYLVMKLIPRSKLDVKEKYVLITGCDSGFGRETAIRLDEMGVCVLATCLTKEGEQSLKSVTSDRIKTFQMDVANSQQINDVFKEVKRRIPRGTGKQFSLFFSIRGQNGKYSNFTSCSCVELKDKLMSLLKLELKFTEIRTVFFTHCLFVSVMKGQYKKKNKVCCFVIHYLCDCHCVTWSTRPVTKLIR